MKISLFVHMERINAEESQSELYAQMLELCKIADDNGMHTIWTGEHHAMNFTITPNPFLPLIDLHRLTKNVRLGTGTIVAPYWHPIKLAGEAAMTDLITQGRLELGIARGAYTYEYDRLQPGMDAWDAGQRMRELVPTLRALWQGDYEHNGDYWQFPSTTSAPQPFTSDGPPIWIAARDSNSHKFAVENNFNVQCTPLWQDDEEVISLMQRFNEAVAICKPKIKPKSMLLRHAYVATDKADALQAAEELSRFYNYFGAWFKNEKPVRQGLIETLDDKEIANNEMFSTDKMLKAHVIGEKSEVIERLQFYQELGWDEYSFWIDSGMPFERKKASLMRFVNDVMPFI